ncbi:MAG: hypothetical protein R3A45_12405 [Bdellovibrionota bacterium]
MYEGYDEETFWESILVEAATFGGAHAVTLYAGGVIYHMAVNGGRVGYLSLAAMEGTPAGWIISAAALGIAMVAQKPLMDFWNLSRVQGRIEGQLGWDLKRLEWAVGHHAKFLEPFQYDKANHCSYTLYAQDYIEYVNCLGNQIRQNVTQFVLLVKMHELQVVAQEVLAEENRFDHGYAQVFADVGEFGKLVLDPARWEQGHVLDDMHAHAAHMHILQDKVDQELNDYQQKLHADMADPWLSELVTAVKDMQRCRTDFINQSPEELLDQLAQWVETTEKNAQDTQAQAAMDKKRFGHCLDTITQVETYLFDHPQVDKYQRGKPTARGRDVYYTKMGATLSKDSWMLAQDAYVQFRPRYSIADVMKAWAYVQVTNQKDFEYVLKYANPEDMLRNEALRSVLNTMMGDFLAFVMMWGDEDHLIENSVSPVRTFELQYGGAFHKMAYPGLEYLFDQMGKRENIAAEHDPDVDQHQKNLTQWQRADVLFNAYQRTSGTDTQPIKSVSIYLTDKDNTASPNNNTINQYGLSGKQATAFLTNIYAKTAHVILPPDASDDMASMQKMLGAYLWDMICLNVGQQYQASQEDGMNTSEMPSVVRKLPVETNNAYTVLFSSERSSDFMHKFCLSENENLAEKILATGQSAWNAMKLYSDDQPPKNRADTFAVKPLSEAVLDEYQHAVLLIQVLQEEPNIKQHGVFRTPLVQKDLWFIPYGWFKQQVQFTRAGLYAR